MIDAFKEWAVVVDALASGRQIILLHKGGISEGAGGFTMKHPKFLLFPTLFHQQRDSVIPSAQARFDALAPVLSRTPEIYLHCWAEAVHSLHLTSFQNALSLSGQHIWRDEVIEQRFEWGGEHAIHAVAVRVFKLRKAVKLPMLPEYAGCKSWVQLREDVSTEGSEPVLNDAEFQAMLDRFQNSLNSTLPRAAE